MKHPWLREYLSMQGSGDCISGAPLVELIGNKRLLIENHQGVIEYGPQQITIKIKNGFIQIRGDNLTLIKMTKEQLVITGCVRCITLEEAV